MVFSKTFLSKVLDSQVSPQASSHVNQSLTRFTFSGVWRQNKVCGSSGNCWILPTARTIVQLPSKLHGSTLQSTDRMDLVVVCAAQGFDSVEPVSHSSSFASPETPSQYIRVVDVRWVLDMDMQAAFSDSLAPNPSQGIPAWRFLVISQGRRMHGWIDSHRWRKQVCVYKGLFRWGVHKERNSNPRLSARRHESSAVRNPNHHQDRLLRYRKFCGYSYAWDMMSVALQADGNSEDTNEASSLNGSGLPPTVVDVCVLATVDSWHWWFCVLQLSDWPRLWTKVSNRAIPNKAGEAVVGFLDSGEARWGCKCQFCPCPSGYLFV